MFPDSCESVLPDVCNSMTTNRIPHAKKVSEEGKLVYKMYKAPVKLSVKLIIKFFVINN